MSPPARDTGTNNTDDFRCPNKHTHTHANTPKTSDTSDSRFERWHGQLFV